MDVYQITSKQAKQRALRAVMAVMGEDGKEVVIRDVQTEGTREQEAWLNILCRMLAQETGNGVEAIKASVKVDKWGYHTAEIGGKSFEFLPRSNYYGMKGYSELIDGVYQLAAELGAVLPNPKKHK